MWQLPGLPGGHGLGRELGRRVVADSRMPLSVTSSEVPISASTTIYFFPRLRAAAAWVSIVISGGDGRVLLAEFTA